MTHDLSHKTTTTASHASVNGLNTIRAHALCLVQEGWSVFPLKPNSKDPFTPGDRRLRGGIHRATRDAEVIARWFEIEPAINIGMIPRGPTVDVDCAKHPKEPLNIPSIMAD